MFKNLLINLKEISKGSISTERKEILQNLVENLARKNPSEEQQVIFICTHNSRRSQLCQAWFQAISYYLEVPFRAYSGGTQTTGFYSGAVKALETAGFQTDKSSSSTTDAIVEVTYSQHQPAIKMFSKLYNDPSNPSSGFTAVMTCSQAEEDCPFVTGAVNRVAVPYEDPKAFDGTRQEQEKYNERSRQIAIEMYYVIKEVKNRNQTR